MDHMDVGLSRRFSFYIAFGVLKEKSTKEEVFEIFSFNYFFMIISKYDIDWIFGLQLLLEYKQRGIFWFVGKFVEKLYVMNNAVSVAYNQ